MSTQPEALRLADLQDAGYFKEWRNTANELRRLHEAHDWQYKMAGERLSRLEKAERRIAALEKALSQAVEALEQSNRFVWHYADNERTARMAQACDDAITTARQTLGGNA